MTYPDDGWAGGLDEALRYVDIFMPNARESQKAARVDDPETAVQKLANIVPLVVVKLGSEGAMAQHGTERFMNPARRVESMDAVRTGDIFDAGFLHEYLHGGDLPACLAAGISLGLSPPPAREESRLFATQPTARNSLKNIVWESKKLRT